MALVSDTLFSFKVLNFEHIIAQIASKINSFVFATLCFIEKRLFRFILSFW